MEGTERPDLDPRQASERVRVRRFVDSQIRFEDPEVCLSVVV